jgi:hypothetical protein
VNAGAEGQRSPAYAEASALRVAELAGLAVLEEEPTGHSARRVLQTYRSLGRTGSWNYFALKRGNYRQTFRDRD